MTAVTLIKSPNGTLIPAFDSDREALSRFKTGSTIQCQVTQPRNPKFHRKFMSLVQFLYDIWEEGVPRQTYRGIEVRPNIERFRKDLTILAGYYVAHYNIRGEVRLEAESISFAKMNEERFERLYSSVIDVALRKVINRPDLTPELVRQLVDQIMQYD